MSRTIQETLTSALDSCGNNTDELAIVKASFISGLHYQLPIGRRRTSKATTHAEEEPDKQKGKCPSNPAYVINLDDSDSDDSDSDSPAIPPISPLVTKKADTTATEEATPATDNNDGQQMDRVKLNWVCLVDEFRKLDLAEKDRARNQQVDNGKRDRSEEGSNNDFSDNQNRETNERRRRRI